MFPSTKVLPDILTLYGWRDGTVNRLFALAGSDNGAKESDGMGVTESGRGLAVGYRSDPISGLTGG